MVGTENRLIVRRLGEAMVIFDSDSWESHLLPPPATIIVDIIAELSVGGTVALADLKQVLRDDYDLDTDSSEISGFLGMLREIGMLNE